MPLVTHAAGIYYFTDTNRRIIDACGGSAVACLGHDNSRIRAAISRQLDQLPYCHSQFFTHQTSEMLAKTIIESTDNRMARLLTLSSGSEALEAALKLARQYFLELPEPQNERIHFISRRPSYHGATLMALGVGGHVSRRTLFEPMLTTHTKSVSQCNTYRGLLPGETISDFNERLAAELDEAFCSFPVGSVAAFVAEPVTGASTGSVPAPPGYFKAIKSVCESHGALLILDEVMCGIGRTGTMHAWQQEEVTPNIQVIGKAFGGGYVPISGLLMDHDVDKVLSAGSGRFSHGQSFQAHPVACAAALEIQRIIREDNVLANVKEMGDRLSTSLRNKLGSHAHVGDIRGKGLFWSIEFVQDVVTKDPFPASRGVGYAFHEFAMQEPYNICVYPGAGTIDGSSGDHILLAPAYNITADEVDLIAEKVSEAVMAFFSADDTAATSGPLRQW
jgi:adenosylmethionine-8-amino-7-oxononanoate aminotransferase